jgi:ankyrin repeat protein
VNAANDDGETPLHTNVKSASYEFLQCLVNHGADVNAKDKHGRSVLYHALREHSLPATKLLLCPDGGDSSTEGTLAPSAVGDGDLLVTDPLGDSILHKLARSEEFAECLPHVIALLMRHGVEIDWNLQNAQGSTCLHVALRHQNVVAVQYLLAHARTADLKDVRDQQGQSIVDLLLDEMDLTTLLALIEKRGREWMDDAVKRAILDARDEDSGYCLLHKAAASGSLEGVHSSSCRSSVLLLDHRVLGVVLCCDELGFDVNQPVDQECLDAYSTGGTPLHLAVEHGNEPVVRHLLAKGEPASPPPLPLRALVRLPSRCSGAQVRT